MYLDDLDSLLRAGASTLSEGLRERQRRFLRARRQGRGGFPGRLGGADLYYTDFALRVCGLLGVPAGDLEYLNKTEDFLLAWAPRDVVECFSWLNAARLLGRLNAGAPADHPLSPAPRIDISPFASRIPQILASRRLEEGGFARPGGREVSAYDTFLAALCFEMLEEPFPEPGAAAAAVARLKRPDGGYADLPGVSAGQTSATAAAIALLTMTGALTAPDPEAVAFLCSMQAPDGGFRAAATAPESDQLSTFTALVTLFALDGMKKIDLGAAVRFTGRLAAEDGGFRASPTDTEPDIEYTYYGLGVLALARAYVELIRGLDAAES